MIEAKVSGNELCVDTEGTGEEIIKELVRINVGIAHKLAECSADEISLEQMIECITRFTKLVAHDQKTMIVDMHAEGAHQ